MINFKQLLILILISIPLACGDYEAGEQNLVRLINEGNLCVTPSGISIGDDSIDELTFISGEPADIIVAYPGCLSSSCDVNRASSGEVTQTSTRAYLVTSELSWTETGASTCTSDCENIFVRLSTPELTSGTYTVSLDDQTIDFTVGGEPTSIDELCVPNRPFQDF